ncbi:MAG: hypothetical protein H6585_08480 [Flavobacteriales bacterium]|nr:hypothetical protein [Flavobacteriales bacterium]MCB9448365.1 hypothetical protein [Flavobacteriales bacterium]
MNKGKSASKYVWMQVWMCFLACTYPRVGENEIVRIGNLICLKSDSTPYTGELVEHFSNGEVSSSFHYKDGMQSGTWRIYGFQGEVIQEGEYVRDPEVASILKNHVAFDTYSLSRWKEGDVNFVTLDIHIKRNDELPFDSLSNTIYMEVRDRLETGNVEILFSGGDSILYAFRNW